MDVILHTTTGLVNSEIPNKVYQQNSTWKLFGCDVKQQFQNIYYMQTNIMFCLGLEVFDLLSFLP